MERRAEITNLNRQDSIYIYKVEPRVQRKKEKRDPRKIQDKKNSKNVVIEEVEGGVYTYSLNKKPTTILKARRALLEERIKN